VAILGPVVEGMRGPELIAAEIVEGVCDDVLDRLRSRFLAPRRGAQWHMARRFDHDGFL
jgi:hypothetical protein